MKVVRPARKQKRKRGKSTRTAKKVKKTAPGDIWQALLLTAVLIVISAVVSVVLMRITPSKAASAENTAVIIEEKPLAQEAVQDNPPVQPAPKEPAVTPKSPPPPQTKPPVKPSPSAKAPTSQKMPTPMKAPNSTKAPVSVKAVVPVQAKAPPELPPKPKYQGTLVFIIDDAGNNLAELEPFLRFPGPLTIAVLPGLPHSAEAARRIRAAGKEVFLHQPMEAIGGQAPGPESIYSDMDSTEVLAILRRNIAEVGPIAGINNHQGSKITMNRQIMETILRFCRDQDICFLDSRTTTETTAPGIALSLGMKIGERNIFIDNEQDRSSMNRFIQDGLTVAARKGNAVMIGHTWSPALAPLLTELYQNLLTQGYTLTTASNFIRK